MDKMRHQGVVAPSQWAAPALRGCSLYDALTGLSEAGRDGIPRALPWAKLFRPVGALHLLLDKALKGRHSIAQGNALGPNPIESSKPCKGAISHATIIEPHPTGNRQHFSVYLLPVRGRPADFGESRQRFFERAVVSLGSSTERDVELGRHRFHGGAVTLDFSQDVRDDIGMVLRDVILL